MSILLISRFATRRILDIRTNYNLIFGTSSRAMAVPPPPGCLQVVKQRPDETHDEKNVRLKRPLSPHLTIYKPQVSSIFSISHRITGTVFSMYTVLFAVYAFFCPLDLESAVTALENRDIPICIIYFGRFAFAFPIMYHGINGIRHLSWDTGNFLDMKMVYITGFIMVGTVIASTMAVVFLT